MPIRTFATPTYSFCTQDYTPNAACWTLLHGEDLNLGHHPEVTALYVSAYSPGRCMHSSLNQKRNISYALQDPCGWCRTSAQLFKCGPSCMSEDLEIEPFTLPPIAEHFPNLTKLVFQNWDNSWCFIENITDLPASLHEIWFYDTFIRDLTPVLKMTPRLQSFYMARNAVPIEISVPFPSSMNSVVFFQTTIVDPMELNETIFKFVVIQCNTSRIYGLKNIYELEFTQCNTPYDNAVIDPVVIDPNIPNVTATIEHISKVNTVYRYQQICAIRSRTRNAYDHRDEPIVAALFLASNVPRRMLEFVSPEVKPPQIPANNRAHLDDDEDVYVYQDDDLYDY